MCANSVRAVLSLQHTELFHPIVEPILLPRTMHDGLEIPVNKKKKIKSLGEAYIDGGFFQSTGRSRG